MCGVHVEPKKHFKSSKCLPLPLSFTKLGIDNKDKKDFDSYVASTALKHEEHSDEDDSGNIE